MKCKECNTINDSMDVVCKACGNEIELKNNKLASFSVLLGVLGILSPLLEFLLAYSYLQSALVVLVLLGIHILVGLASISMGIFAKTQIKKSEGKETGSDIAITGIIMGIISLLFLAAFFTIFIKFGLSKL